MIVLAMSKTCGSGSVSDVSREDEDGRVGRVDLAVGRPRRQVGGQLAAGGVDRRLHVARGGVDVAVEVELERDLTSSPSELEDVISATPGDAPEAPLERRGDGRGHRLRAGARQRAR